MINPDNISVSSVADKSTSSQDYMSGRNFMKPDALINPASSSDACGTSYTVINPASLCVCTVINKANFAVILFVARGYGRLAGDLL